MSLIIFNYRLITFITLEKLEIQVGTPPKNVVAMYEAVYEYYGIKNELLFNR